MKNKTTIIFLIAIAVISIVSLAVFFPENEESIAIEEAAKNEIIQNLKNEANVEAMAKAKTEYLASIKQTEEQKAMLEFFFYEAEMSGLKSGIILNSGGFTGAEIGRDTITTIENRFGKPTEREQITYKYIYKIGKKSATFFFNGGMLQFILINQG